MTDSKNVERAKEIIYFSWAKTVDQETINALLGKYRRAWLSRAPKAFEVSDDIKNGGFFLKGTLASGEVVVAAHMALVKTPRELKARLNRSQPPAGVNFPAVVLTHPDLPGPYVQLMRCMSLFFADLMRVHRKPVAMWINQVDYTGTSASTGVLKADFGDVVKLWLNSETFDWEWTGDLPFASHLLAMGHSSVFARNIYR